MENSERVGAAFTVAQWFAGLTHDEPPEASAHYLVDSDEIIQAVREEDVAWGAKGGNRQSIHVELAGKASQTSAEWLDGYSERVLSRAAHLVADICQRRSIPVKPLGPQGLLMGERGITTHAAITEAFRKGDHHDPGPGFPLNVFIDMVRRAA